jgi:hypothetical protein
MKPKEQEGDEVEEGSPDNGDMRRQHTRGNDGRYRVCCVMKTVEEIKDQGDPDESDNEGERASNHGRPPCRLQACSITMP